MIRSQSPLYRHPRTAGTLYGLLMRPESQASDAFSEPQEEDRVNGSRDDFVQGGGGATATLQDIQPAEIRALQCSGVER